jgi:AraC-like DNA-binding protein
LKLFIDIARHLSPQFAARMGGEPLPNGFVLHPDLGSPAVPCTFVEFPGTLELYHFGLTRFSEPLEMQTINSEESEWYLIHINLSIVAQRKQINDEQVSFHKHLPIGILFCGQQLEMNTTIPPGVDAEVASIRFSKSFLRDYFGDVEQRFDLERSIAYEDLDELLEKKLLLAISCMQDKISCHAHILEFLSVFFKKLGQHDRVIHSEKCHPQDLENIFKVSVMLRNPLENQAPSIRQLAEAAHMSPSKFKDLFKKVFGKPPLAYRNKIRMEYARDALQSGECTPTEMSYRLGFAHPSNFTAAYKKHFEALPSSV